jgi:CheY-like chemotaxis protein
MRPATSGGILLLSAAPDAHEVTVDALRRHGATVRVAREPGRALELLRSRPTLVLVDLVHGPAIDRRVVSRLNGSRGSTMVVALHEGRLDLFQEAVADLSVDGFCRSGDWRPLTGITSPPGALSSTMVH